jgi:hypothetical protein
MTMNSDLPMPPDEAAIGAYLGNQLPESQARTFEIYCLDHPEFARKVESDLILKLGLREIGMIDRRRGPTIPFRPRWAMAASLGAVVGCGLLLVAWSLWRGHLVAYRNPSEIPPELRNGVHLEVTLQRLRGPVATHRIVAPRSTGVLELKIYPDSPPGRNGYSAHIVVDSLVGVRSIVLNQLRGDASGWLELDLPLSEVVGHALDITLTSDANPSIAPVPAVKLQVIAATG